MAINGDGARRVGTGGGVTCDSGVARRGNGGGAGLGALAGIRRAGTGGGVICVSGTACRGKGGGGGLGALDDAACTFARAIMAFQSSSSSAAATRGRKRAAARCSGTSAHASVAMSARNEAGVVSARWKTDLNQVRASIVMLSLRQKVRSAT
ncbi:MAG TPA: hypothetical protein VKQ32_10725 [Polyangia bacterium]|nr:hypothetical protein [Polyangia bacterium]